MNVPIQTVGLILTIFITRWILNKYFSSNPDRMARRAVKTTYPAWLSIFSILTWVVSWGAITLLLFVVEGYLNQYLHPGIKLLNIGTTSLSAILVSARILAPFAIGFSLSFILANIVFWVIPPVRRIMQEKAKGVPGASFKESNAGLLKVAYIVVPISLVLGILSIVYT